MRILLVEDEPLLSEQIVDMLGAAGMACDNVTTIADATDLPAEIPYDAAILDLGLPDGDGSGLLRRWRNGAGAMPVLILSARGDVADRVAGLNGGADDYLAKPFASAELLARLRALMRRPGGALGAVLAAGNVTLDTIARELRVAGVPLRAGRQETAVLEILLRRQGRVVPRRVLEDKIYSFESELGSNPIPVHVHHLRRLLEIAGADIAIHTVRGVGYLLGQGQP